MSIHLHTYITKLLREAINDNGVGLRETLENGGVWYHGTPDVREVEKEGGFTQRTIDVEYVKDPVAFQEVQQQMSQARESGNEDLYHKLIDTVPTLKDHYRMNKPIFLTNHDGVARTYADPMRAYDYQNAVEKVLKVRVKSGNVVRINAPGDRFRFIDVNKVRSGFINSGTPEEDIDKLIKMFNFYVRYKDGIRTDVVAAIGQWLGYDTIDVVGVLDSYNGGSVKSTVRMVFDPANITLVK